MAVVASGALAGKAIVSVNGNYFNSAALCADGSVIVWGYGGYGAMRSLMALRQVLEQGCGALVIPDQIAVARAGDAFDEMDNLKDEANARRLKGVVQSLIEFARDYA